MAWLARVREQREKDVVLLWYFAESTANNNISICDVSESISTANLCLVLFWFYYYDEANFRGRLMRISSTYDD